MYERSDPHHARPASCRARCATLALSLLFLVAPRVADAETTRVLLVSGDCLAYYMGAHGFETEASWGSVLSFATCIQDTAPRTLAPDGDVAALVEDIAAGMRDSLEVFVAAFERGPTTVKQLAAYHIAMAQVSVMTRARAAVCDPAQHELLERELAIYGQRAYILYSAIERAAEQEPLLVGDEVLRNIARSARRYAADLRATHGREDAKRLSRRAPWI